MGSSRNYNLDADTLNHYVGIDKTIDREVVFKHYPRVSKRTPTGYHQWKSTYILSSNDTVDNLYLTLKSMRNIDYEYHSFLLSYRHKGVENFIYHLEVYPDYEISHREPNGESIFGPHIHHLMRKVVPVRPEGYINFTWYEWLEYFNQQTNITINAKVKSAFDGELDL